MILVKIKRGDVPAVGDRFGDLIVTDVGGLLGKGRIQMHHVNESRGAPTGELLASRLKLAVSRARPIHRVNREPVRD